jgi:hypothetical protein
MKLFLLILLPTMAFAGGQKYRYPSPRGLDDEMQNIYQNIPNKNTTPAIYIGAGAPSFTPGKIGDIFVSTTTSKVYLSTSTVTSGSWSVLN